MKSIVKTGLLLAVIFLCGSCSFIVTAPKALQGSSQEYTVPNGHIQIVVTFNDKVDVSTVVVGKTLILITDKDPNASGSITQSPDGQSITFLTTKTTTDLLNFSPDGHFTLKLIGTDIGNGAVKSKNGRLLDGDSDGKDGGDYKTSFTLVG